MNVAEKQRLALASDFCNLLSQWDYRLLLQWMDTRRRRLREPYGQSFGHLEVTKSEAGFTVKHLKSMTEKQLIVDLGQTYQINDAVYQLALELAAMEAELVGSITQKTALILLMLGRRDGWFGDETLTGLVTVLPSLQTVPRIITSETVMQWLDCTPRSLSGTVADAINREVFRAIQMNVKPKRVQYETPDDTSQLELTRNLTFVLARLLIAQAQS